LLCAIALTLQGKREVGARQRDVAGLRPFGNAQAITHCGEPMQLSIVGKNFSPKIAPNSAPAVVLTDCAMMKQCR